MQAAKEHSALNRFITEPGARARSRGVTLLELMAVVVIIGILGTLAVNSYRSYLLRTNRTEARMALLRLQAAQEKFFLQNNRYATQAEMYALPSAGGLGIAATTETGKYAITLPVRTDTTYTGRAVAAGGQTADAAACLTLEIDESGRRTPTGGECWR
jgi:type IV pilus assembly protein PilE